jgi:hypothetical protein
VSIIYWHFKLTLSTCNSCPLVGTRYIATFAYVLMTHRTYTCTPVYTRVCISLPFLIRSSSTGLTVLFSYMNANAPPSPSARVPPLLAPSPAEPVSPSCTSFIQCWGSHLGVSGLDIIQSSLYHASMRLTLLLALPLLLKGSRCIALYHPHAQMQCVLTVFVL